MWLERGDQELAARALEASDGVDVRTAEKRDLGRDAFAVKGVESAVELVEDVEGQGLDALDSKDQGCCYDGLLASGEA